MASIRKRAVKGGFSWSVDIRKKGLPNISRSFSTEEEAKRFARLNESVGDSVKIPQNLPMRVLIDRYIEEKSSKKKWYTRSRVLLLFWKQHIGHMGCEEVTPMVIEHFANLLYKMKTKKGTPYSPATRRTYIMALSACFKCAMVEWRWCTKNPCSTVPLHMDLINSIQKKPIDVEDQVQMCKKKFLKQLKEHTAHLSEKEKESICRTARSSWGYFMQARRNTSLSQLFKIATAFGLDVNITVTVPDKENMDILKK